MSSFHLVHHFLDGHVSPGQEVSQQNLDVRTTQQRMALLVGELLLQHEEHRHHHQSHVVVPGTPTTYLVVSQAALTLGILERALDPKPLPLHLHKTLQRSLRRGIAQDVLDRLLRAYLPDDHNVPEASLLLPAIPQPHTTVQGLHPHLSLGAGPNRDSLPKLRRLSRRPGVDSLAGALGLKVRRLLAATPFLGHAGSGVFRIDLLIFMHVGDEDFPVIRQPTHKGRLLAIPTIDSHPTKTHTVLARLHNHLEG